MSNVNLKDDPELIKLNHEAHIVAYDLLNSTANWLEDPNNEVYGCLEDNEESLNIAAHACLLASAVLKKATLDIQLISGIEDNDMSRIEKALNQLQALADELDSSGDSKLQKKAGVLDEILLTVAADVEEKNKYKKEWAKKINEIKQRAAKSNEQTKIATEPANKKEPEKKSKEVRPLEKALSSRYCPKHHGAMWMPVAGREDTWQCPVDGEIISFKEGYTALDGKKVPGTATTGQTDMDTHVEAILSTKY